MGSLLLSPLLSQQQVLGREVRSPSRGDGEPELREVTHTEKENWGLNPCPASVPSLIFPLPLLFRWFSLLCLGIESVFWLLS